MFNEELRNLLIQVLTSWQVLAVTVVLVLYIFLVNYVARIYHRRRQPPKAKIQEQIVEEAAPHEADELGFEEEEAEE